MKIIPSTAYSNLQDIVLDSSDNTNLEDAYKLFITKAVEYLKPNISDDSIYKFFLLLIQAQNYYSTYPVTSLLNTKDSFSDFEKCFVSFIRLGTPNAGKSAHFNGTVQLNTFLAAYVCFVALVEKYWHIIDDFNTYKNYYQFNFNYHNKYDYDTSYLINNLYTVKLDPDPVYTYKPKRGFIEFKKTIKAILTNFEREIYVHVFNNTNSSCDYNKSSQDDILKKAFNVGMFTFNPGKVNTTIFLRDQNYALCDYLSSNPELLNFFLEKVFLYPSPSYTGIYKQMYMTTYNQGLYSTTKLDSAQFCTYLKTRGHPINTKTARLITSFAGVFDDPLGFDYYLTKFLYTTSDSSRGKKLIDDIKYSIECCEDRVNKVKAAEEAIIKQKISVFEHFVNLGRYILVRNKIEKYLTSTNRQELLVQFSRGEKGEN